VAASGTGIFSDDTAADVRDDWREALLEGLDPAAATQKLVRDYSEALDDVEDANVFWLALAAAQMQTGRLQPDVREHALQVIESGRDLERWSAHDVKLARQRERVLAKLAEKLRGPQRPPTKLRRPAVTKNPLARGDVVLVNSRRRKAGALFLVIGETESWPPGSTEPVVVPLLWDGPDLPTAEQAASLPVVVTVDADAAQRGARPRAPRVEPQGVHSPSRGKLALANHGEVVLRGVDHPHPPPHAEPDTYTSWSGLVEWIDGPWYAACVAETRRLAGVD
jgi:hypothetical protein